MLHCIFLEDSYIIIKEREHDKHSKTELLSIFTKNVHHMCCHITRLCPLQKLGILHRVWPNNELAPRQAVTRGFLLHLYFWAIVFDLNSYSGCLNVDTINHFTLLATSLGFWIYGHKILYLIESYFCRYSVDKCILEEMSQLQQLGHIQFSLTRTKSF